MSTPTPDISTIVSKMKTQATTTLDWDVVVNYNEEELNNLLAIAHQDPTKKSVNELECSLTGTDQFGDDFTISYKFVLSAPSIKFIATYIKPVCSLTIKILGGTASTGTDGTTQFIGDGVYTMSLENLELASAKGGESITSPIPSDKPFVFPPDAEGDGVVFINFEASKDLFVDITFTGPAKCPSNSTDPGCLGRASLVDAQLGNLTKAIRNIFLTEYAGIRYELARVNSSKPDDGDVQLVPKSFRFAAYTPTSDGGTAATEGETILSLFIQTHDVIYGEQRDIDLQWNSLWKTTLKCPPIPFGKTASIILGKNMVFRSIIEPAMEKKGYSSNIDNTVGNLQIQVDTGKKIIAPRDATSEWVGIPGFQKYVTTCRHSAIDVTLPDLQLKLEQDDSNDKAHCRGSWNYKYLFEWYITISGSQSQFGNVTIENTLDEVFSAISLRDKYTLQMALQIEQDNWKVETKPDSQSFWQEIMGGSERTPDWVDDLKVFLPTIDINMGSLNFFLTTNLLLPSREVIDIDINEGVKVPGDFYIVGNVKKSKRIGSDSIDSINV